MKSMRSFKAKAFEELKNKLMQFVGKRVKIYKRHGDMVVGRVRFLSFTSPFIVILEDEDSFLHVINFKEIQEMECRERFTLQ